MDIKPAAKKPDAKKTQQAEASKPVKPSLGLQLASIGNRLKNNLSIIVTVLIVGVLGYTFLTISTILTQSDDLEYREEQTKKGIRSSFDQKTIDKIEDLRTSNDSANIKLPSGRINPFIE